MLRLAEVVRCFRPALSGLSPQQGKVCHQILRCRTPALGGFQLQCQECGEEQVLYHACRNRHCPRCQQQASEQWQQRELANVVDASYFHLVFTLPHALNGGTAVPPDKSGGSGSYPETVDVKGVGGLYEALSAAVSTACFAPWFYAYPSLWLAGECLSEAAATACPTGDCGTGGNTGSDR